MSFFSLAAIRRPLYLPQAPPSRLRAGRGISLAGLASDALLFWQVVARTLTSTDFPCGGQILWHLHPNSERRVILTPISVVDFVDALHNATPFRRVR